MQGAWKVGLLVVVFVGLLVGAYQFLGRSFFAPKTTDYFAEVSDVSGVNVGAPVLLAGVKIGSVSKVELKNPKLARLTLAIEGGNRIPAGSTVSVPTPLLGFGDNPVYVVPPAVLAGGDASAGSTLSGTRLGAFEGILPNLDQTVAELNKTLVAARELVADPALKNSLTKLVDTGSKTLERFGALAASTQGLLADNRQAITSSLQSVQMAMIDVQKSAAIARQLIADPMWKEQTSTLMTSMDQTIRKAEEVMASVDAMINDPNMRRPIQESLSNVQNITESGTRIAANTEKITENGVTISENVATLTAKANELAEEAKTVLKKLQEFFNKVPSTTGIKGVTAGMDLLRENEPNHWRTDFSAKVPLKDSTLHMGIRDAFEGNDLTLQLGRPFKVTNEYRYGVYASKPGVGVDFKLARGLMFKGDLYDINDPRLDLGVRYEFKDGLLGWIGFNRAFDRNAFFAGLGFRK